MNKAEHIAGIIIGNCRTLCYCHCTGKGAVNFGFVTIKYIFRLLRLVLYWIGNTQFCFLHVASNLCLISYVGGYYIWLKVILMFSAVNDFRTS